MWAQLNLAHMYREGFGVAQNHGEAVRWYRKAADQGLDLAQANLGWMYLNGLGVEPDDGAAAQWYQRAAEQGNAEAQNNLGVMNATGRGVPRNDVQAYVWFSLAAAQGYADAAQNRDLSAEQLSPARLSEAKLIARQTQANAAARRPEYHDLGGDLKSQKVRF
jgi:TPR repeat protein